MVFQWEQKRRWEKRESKIRLAQAESGINGTSSLKTAKKVV
jgi:hypothetical protein